MEDSFSLKLFKALKSSENISITESSIETKKKTFISRDQEIIYKLQTTIDRLLKSILIIRSYDPLLKDIEFHFAILWRLLYSQIGQLDISKLILYVGKMSNSLMSIYVQTMIPILKVSWICFVRLFFFGWIKYKDIIFLEGSISRVISRVKSMFTFIMCICLCEVKIQFLD